MFNNSVLTVLLITLAFAFVLHVLHVEAKLRKVNEIHARETFLLGREISEGLTAVDRKLSASIDQTHAVTINTAEVLAANISRTAKPEKRVAKKAASATKVAEKKAVKKVAKKTATKPTPKSTKK